MNQIIKKKEFDKYHIAIRKFIYALNKDFTAYEVVILLECIREDLRAEMLIRMLEDKNKKGWRMKVKNKQCIK